MCMPIQLKDASDRNLYPCLFDVIHQISTFGKSLRAERYRLYPVVNLPAEGHDFAPIIEAIAGKCIGYESHINIAFLSGGTLDK